MRSMVASFLDQGEMEARAGAEREEDLNIDLVRPNLVIEASACGGSDTKCATARGEKTCSVESLPASMTWLPRRMSSHEVMKAISAR